MEAIAQKVQDALGKGIAVYLGSEWLVKEPKLPHVIVVPGDATYGPPEGVRDALAGVTANAGFVCKALLFEEATLLAEACYAAVAPAGRTASMRLSSELWGDRVIRVATITIPFTGALLRTGVTRAHVEQILARYHLPRPTTDPQEVPDDQEIPNYTGSFVDSA